MNNYLSKLKVGELYEGVQTGNLYKVLGRGTWNDARVEVLALGPNNQGVKKGETREIGAQFLKPVSYKLTKSGKVSIND